MRKSVENLATSKTTGGRRHPLRIRRKYETDRYPNEAVNGAQVTITRRVRGNNKKTSIKRKWAYSRIKEIPICRYQRNNDLYVWQILSWRSLTRIRAFSIII